MTARVLDGRAVARRLLERTASLAQGLPRPPGLAVVLAGEDPGSRIYVRRKGEAAAKLGFVHRQIDLPATCTLAELLVWVDGLNADDAVDGILVQLPLPGGLDGRVVTERIDPRKDVDGLTTANTGALAQGRPNLVPCTPLGVTHLLAEAGFDPAGREAVVIGRSNLFGRPMAMLLEQRNATVTLAHSRTRNLPDVVRRAELVVAAVGRPELVRRDWIRPGAVVIDVGMNRLADGRVVGDVATAEVAEVASVVTPVPGGVGPLTIAMLMDNTLRASAARQGIALR
jgi:methylenetetrahydrofolate dehydrogenase (NADP+)/methenyltetrahydrofolate cyclohydrolase